MTREEFMSVMLYLSAGCEKPVQDATLEVYYDLLGDLPLPALQAAAQRALAESQYPMLPPIGVLRRLATEALAGPERGLTAAEAWRLAAQTVNRFGLHHEAEALASLPPRVAHAVRVFGWRRLCDSPCDDRRSDSEPTHFAQWRAAYESIQQRDERESLLPGKLKAQIAALAGQIGLEREAGYPRLLERQR